MLHAKAHMQCAFDDILSSENTEIVQRDVSGVVNCIRAIEYAVERMNDHALSAAVFYPSYQLKLRRVDYYEHLMAVRENGEYEKWVGFFCDCLLTSAEDAVRSLDCLVNLHNDNSAGPSSHHSAAAARGG